MSAHTYGIRNSCGSRGHSGVSLEPPSPPPVFKNLMKMKLFVRPNYLTETKLFHFHWIFKKNEIKSAKTTPQVYTYDPPFQKSWIYPCITSCNETSLKRPLKKKTKIGFQNRLSFNAGQKYCRMLEGEHSAILSTFIKLPFAIKNFVLSTFEWPLKKSFTVLAMAQSSLCIWKVRLTRAQKSST